MIVSQVGGGSLTGPRPSPRSIAAIGRIVFKQRAADSLPEDGPMTRNPSVMFSMLQRSSSATARRAPLASDGRSSQRPMESDIKAGLVRAPAPWMKKDQCTCVTIF